MKRSTLINNSALPGFFIVALVTLGLTGCGTSKTTMADDVSPIQISEGQSGRAVAIADVISEVTMDDRIGTEHRGALNIPYGSYYGSKVSESLTLIPTGLVEELARAGYKVDQRKNSLFPGASEADSDGESLLIGGRIILCSYDSYFTAGGSTKSEATVKWQLFDPVEDKIVFEAITSGSARGPHGEVSSIAFAVRSSFRSLLANEDFVSQILGR